MQRKRMRYLWVAGLLLGLGTHAPAEAPDDALARGFADPPTRARLRAYWWWLNGNVTKAAITDAVRAGADTPEAVATATRASTGCGSCTSDVCSLVAALCAAGSPRTSLERVTVA